jgi:hypothetical protein
VLDADHRGLQEPAVLRRSRLRLGANDKTSGVYLVAPDRESYPFE